ncbi:MAG: hypothetical protein ACPHY8_04455 [Patescibacteria group bacterium]
MDGIDDLSHSLSEIVVTKFSIFQYISAAFQDFAQSSTGSCHAGLLGFNELNSTNVTFLIAACGVREVTFQ